MKSRGLETTCRFRTHDACTCAGRIENCPLVVRAFGPARRMCRRCDGDAEPHRLLCAECQAKRRNGGDEWKAH